MDQKNLFVSSIQANDKARFQSGILNSTKARQIMKFNIEDQNKQKEIIPEQIEVDDGIEKTTILMNPKLINNQNLPPIPQKPDLQIKRPDLPSKEGFLYKKSPHYIQGYQKRFCRLDNRTLYYYIEGNKSGTYDHLFGVLNFDLQTYSYQEEREAQGGVLNFSLIPVGSPKVFTFRSDTPKLTTEWASLVNRHLADAHGSKVTIKKLSQIPRFWRHETLSHQQALESAKDGDIILFRGNDFCSIAQRTLTGSEFDHVGIVYLDDGKPWVLESVSSGVGVFKFSSLKSQDWYKFYEKIYLRKLLNVNRNQAFQEQLFQFVSDNIGRQYSFNLAKMTKFQSAIRKPGQSEEEFKKQEANRTYFCSELVAKAYKVLHLLPQEKSSTQYFPGDFSRENEKLKLLNGATLSDEYLIDFDS